MKKSAVKKISAKDFDARFEAGDVMEHMDASRARVINKAQRVNIDFPSDMLVRIDKEAMRCGVARAALIKMWLADRLDRAGLSEK